MENRTARLDRLSRRLFVIDRPRIYYLFIPKCGCTFVKNVLWFIQNGEFHRDQRRIHDDDSAFLRAPDLKGDPLSIRMEPAAFTVVRNPIDRFLSLYFDKVVGEGRRNFVPLARTLIEKRGLLESPLSLKDHRYNIELLADWVRENIADQVDLARDAHWTPQIFRRDIMSTFNLRMLTVDGLSAELAFLLRDAVPSIRSILAGAERNSAQRSTSKADVLSSDIRRRINEIYAGDRRLYQFVRKAWRTAHEDNFDNFDVPRFQDFKT